MSRGRMGGGQDRKGNGWSSDRERALKDRRAIFSRAVFRAGREDVWVFFRACQ